MVVNRQREARLGDMCPRGKLHSVSNTSQSIAFSQPSPDVRLVSIATDVSNAMKSGGTLQRASVTDCRRPWFHDAGRRDKGSTDGSARETVTTSHCMERIAVIE